MTCLDCTRLKEEVERLRSCVDRANETNRIALKQRDDFERRFDSMTDRRDAALDDRDLLREERDALRKQLRRAMVIGTRPQCTRCGHPLTLDCQEARGVPCSPRQGEGEFWLECAALAAPAPAAEGAAPLKVCSWCHSKPCTCPRGHPEVDGASGKQGFRKPDDRCCHGILRADCEECDESVCVPASENPQPFGSDSGKGPEGEK